MVNVAVAGGTGGVGRTILDALIADSRHQTVVLARKVYTSSIPRLRRRFANLPQTPEGVALGCPVIAVDYDDVNALQATLEEHQIHTVISALALHVVGVGKSQINLIKAADKSRPTERFITSNWAVRAPSRRVHPRAVK